VEAHGASTPIHFEFLKIADTTDAPPNRPTDRFLAFDDQTVAMDDGRVLLRGDRTPALPHLPAAGFYLWDQGTLTKIVETDDSIPDESGDSFYVLGYAGMDAGTVAFNGVGFASWELGVYAWRDGALTKIVDEQSTLEGDARKADGFDLPPRVEGENIVTGALLDDGSGALVIGTLDGVPRVLLDESTPVPNLPSGLEYAIPGGISRGRVAVAIGPEAPGQLSFSAGIYTVDLSGKVAVVADRFTLIPGTSAPFQTFSDLPPPSISGDTVAFRAAGTIAPGEVRGGLYGANLTTGEVFTIADTTTVFPEVPGGVVESAVSPAQDGHNTAFVGFGGVNFQALMLKYEGEILPVLAKGETLFGREVKSIFISPESLDGRSIAFWANFTDGAQGIYVATLVPAPSPALLALAPLSLLAPRRRRSPSLSSTLPPCPR
jgi:hypothetical protein